MATITIPEGASIQETTRVAYGPVPAGKSIYAVPFPFFAVTELKVWGSTSGYLSQTTDWTIATVDVDDGYQSGTITLNEPAVNEDILIWREISFSRISEWQTSGPFPMDKLNTTMDKLFAMMQELRTTVDRSVRLDVTDVTETVVLPGVDDRKGKYLYFDATTGAPTVAETIIVDDTPVSISSWVTNNWHSLNSAAEARALLDLEVGTDVQAYNANYLLSTDMVIGTHVQAHDQALDDISGLTPTDGNIIVGDGTNWVAETPATVRATLDLEIGTDVQAYDDTYLVDADIGSTVQAQGSILDDLNTLDAVSANDKFIVSTAAGTFAYEGDQTAMTSMGADGPFYYYGTSDSFSITSLSLAFQTIRMDRSGANTIVLPSNSTVAFPLNTEIYFMQWGDGATTIDISVDTLTVKSSKTKVLNGKYAVAGAKKVTSTQWVLFGDLVDA